METKAEPKQETLRDYPGFLDNVRNEPAGEVMDAFIAARVEGWVALAKRNAKPEEKDTGQWTGLPGPFEREVQNVPHYSLFDNTAWAVLLNFLQQNPYKVEVTIEQGKDSEVYLRDSEQRYDGRTGRGNTLALAICRALLQIAR